ncbi:(13S,14R)-1,13-dihydroxy-N-methylcanadine 13-O-acetyltransferase AT1-like protein [Drosera capensis]
MENIRVEAISKETIKPSVPTPEHLKSFRFSFLDQLSPIVYTPLILFYPKKDGCELLPRLKNSLSETLTKLYPLAGRICGNMTIECDDQGILYLEARVNSSMADFLRAPSVASLGGFLPRKTTCSEPIHEIVQVAIQVTSFECGGIGIATIPSDADANAVSPDLDTAPTLFPGNVLLASHSSTSLATEAGNHVLKRFTFDLPAIEILKSRAKSEDRPNQSSVEVVSVFISKHALLAFNAVNTGDHEGPSSLSHTVNMRSRSIPPLPKGSIGNLCGLAAIEFHAQDELHVLVSRLRQAISGINDGSVKFLQSEIGQMMVYEVVTSSAPLKERNKYMFNSWCKLGFNEVDFGWGPPVWVALSWDTDQTSSHRNQMTLLDGKDREIEAWLVLDEREMVILEQDQEFLSFGSLNKSISY